MHGFMGTSQSSNVLLAGFELQEMIKNSILRTKVRSAREVSEVRSSVNSAVFCCLPVVAVVACILNIYSKLPPFW